MSMVWERIHLYLQLTRLNRPIGIYVLLWQTLWAVWIAGDGTPSPWIVAVFIAGVVSMRSAGCVINDVADRHIDGHVKRTRERPLATGRILVPEALALAGGLTVIAFLLVLTTNAHTIAMSVVALGLAALYPFMKRYTHWPQLFLGLAFSWAIPMAFTAQDAALVPTAWLLFLSAICWIIAYDTEYAMVDRDDDLLIGVRSTAIFFGDYDRVAIGGFQAAFLAGMVLVGFIESFGIVYYVGLACAVGVFIRQHRLIHGRERMPCFRAFLSNHWAGLAVFAGTVLDLSIVPLVIT